ncbi:hypothetical protein Leryth_027125 [Lithospermum erythrorhizon]|nr:hypothetical protein Leryth_027125 [Lithospermum erythrorhizon]
MAVPSTFHERLEQMENTRNQRLSLLQAEKELQSKNYETLSSKIGCVRAVEQRCLNLERSIASQKLLISSLKPEIVRLDSNYHSTLYHLRYGLSIYIRLF